MASAAFRAAASTTLRMTRPFIQFPSPELCALFPEVRQAVRQFLSSEAGLARRHWPKLLRRAYPELSGDALEDMLVKLVIRAYVIRDCLKPCMRHNFLEYCSGQGNLTLECHVACPITYL